MGQFEDYVINQTKQVSDFASKEKDKAQKYIDQQKQMIKDYSSLKNLGRLNDFWEKSKWYLVLLLFIVVLVVYYKKNFGAINMAVAIILVFVFILVIIIFNDNKGTMGNSVSFAAHPLPPHLGLDGISNEIRFVN